ncbi:MAG: DUF434 domain-containing protein [Spirochaetes bacterium]|nr:DUF434 domain-containing protein [Spirochaetota bacterium]
MDVSPAFKEAAEDYFTLLNKQYPERASLALVGDRYRLSKDERMILFRGITSRDRAISRKAKRSPFPKLPELYIDGYNVLFTLLNYRIGKLLFIGNDGFLRDAGGSHGRLTHADMFLELADEFFDHLVTLGFRRVQVYLDSPVSHSAFHAERIRNLLWGKGLEGDCTLGNSADYLLKRSSPPCIASSDTAIIDALPGPFFDAARSYLEKRYGATFLDLSEWFQ